MVPMRALGTWLAVGLIVVVSFVAFVDAFRGEGGREQEETARARERASTPARLRDEAEAFAEAGIAGTLYYIDPRCRFAALRLPDLARSELTTLTSCRVGLSRSGRWVPFGSTWQRHGRLVRRCSERGVAVFDRATPLLGERGCALAWTADGTLRAHVLDGQLVEFADEGAGILFSRRQLALALRDFPGGAGGTYSLREVAFLDGERFAAIVAANRGGARVEFVAVFAEGKTVAEPSFFAEHLSDLEASPRGDFVSVRLGGRDLALLDRRARQTGFFFSKARAIAWSPDGHWAAVAEPDQVVVLEPGERSIRYFALPLVAREIAWR